MSISRDPNHSRSEFINENYATKDFVYSCMNELQANVEKTMISYKSETDQKFYDMLDQHKDQIGGFKDTVRGQRWWMAGFITIAVITILGGFSAFLHTLFDSNTASFSAGYAITENYQQQNKTINELKYKIEDLERQINYEKTKSETSTKSE